MGAIAQVAGLFHRTIRGERGAMDLGTLAEAISAHMKPNKLGTALIEMETTHNGAGGTVLPLDHMAEIYALGRQHGIPVHTDGARLFNAAVALGGDCPLCRWARTSPLPCRCARRQELRACPRSGSPSRESSPRRKLIDCGLWWRS